MAKAKSSTNTTESIKAPQLTEAEIDAGVKEMVEQLKEEPTETLFLPDGAGIQNPLPIAINGAVMAIPVGEPIKVPISIYNLVMNESNVLRKGYGKTPGVEETAKQNAKQ